ncbi:MAG: 23S rRNA (uracil(1939)-C(5))-methyltransferase RlmD [Ruminococcus sp.]|nr:23S rRNA (uracil(1939)-C(5))-methyltransferase RlmD [Ruminococcus sp.]
MEGNGVGRYEGMAVFLPSCAAGDRVKCRIVKTLKNCAYGITEEILVPSGDRQDRGCAVQRTCGGCVFRHLSYEAELRIKENAVKNAFERLGGFDLSETEVLPVLGCRTSDRYRNKAQYPVRADKQGKAVCGFYAKRSHRVVPCGDCLLQPAVFGNITAEIMKAVNAAKIPPYDEEKGTGILRHIYLRRGYHSGEIMVCPVVTREEGSGFVSIAEELAGKFPEIKSVILNVNPKNTNVILGDRCVTLFGKDSITDIMCGNRISVSPLSFYQVNTPQAERLYEIAADFAGLTGNEDVLDLYCGAGTISLSLAKRAGRVTGAEVIPEAAENARKNAAANNIANADFICADAGQAAKLLCESGRKPDAVITDPPRKGCDTVTLESIIKMSPKRTVMISCNPATAARDCRFLADRGYILEKLRAVDMFPGAGHTECAALMTKA